MLKKFSLFTLFALIMMALPGCTDDLFYDNPDVEDQPKGLRINVPSVINTRAEKGTSNPLPGEMEIKSLYLFAFDVDKPTAAPIIKPLSPNDGISYKPNYKSYNIEITNGTYKFYLVANVFNSAAPVASDYQGANLAEGIGKLQKKLQEYTTDMVIGSQIGTGYQGLPMTGDHREMYTKSNDIETSLPDGGFKFNGSANIYVDLVYCVAKVTVNVEQPNGENLDIDKFSLLNYADKFPLFTSFSGNLSGVSKVTNTARVISNASAVNDGKNGETKKTYTLYVPENTYIDATPKLSFEVGDTPISIDLGEAGTTSGAKNVFTRGHHYAYTVSSKGAVSLDVFKWSLEELSTEFTGPFELILYLDGGSKISKVTTTNWTRFNYYSDAETISYESPKFSWTDKAGVTHTEKLYDWDVQGDEMMVRISNKVSLAEFSKLLKTDANGKTVFKNASDKDLYQHFYVKANNLLKKVEIEEIDIQAEFTVNPTTNVIDLREIVATGFSQNTYSIQYASNVGTVVADWKTARWKDEDGTVIENYEKAEVAGICSVAYLSGNDQFTFKNFTNGEAFYNSRKTLEVTYKVEIDESNSDEVAYYNALPVKEYKVKFIVIPFTSNYKIHFKANGWTNPHIYVYQCLELPSNLEGDNKEYSGKTVGQDIVGSADKNAALQYCFTSGFCFQGWDKYGGPEANNPNASGEFKDGFWKFASGDYLPNTGGSSESTLRTNRYMWFNFNAAHYANLIRKGQSGENTRCDKKSSSPDDYKTSQHQCNTEWNPEPYDNTSWAELWPGVIMVDEGDGWWGYELSGVAEPGKTLIMFADGHYKSGKNGNRFPGSDKVGVPLFNYEAKEGWFLLRENGGEDYVKNRFYSYNPDGHVEDPHTIYWPKYKDGKDFNLLYDCIGGNHQTLSKTETIDGVEYYSAIVEGNSGKYVLKATGVNDWTVEKVSKDIQLSASSFSNKCSTITLTTRNNNDKWNYSVIPGKPEAKNDPNKDFILYWKKNYDNQDWRFFYDCGGDNTYGRFKVTTTETIGTTVYYKVNLGKNFTEGEFLIKAQDNIDTWVDKTQTEDFTVKAADFSDNKCVVNIGNCTADNNKKYTVSLSEGSPSSARKRMPKTPKVIKRL